MIISLLSSFPFAFSWRLFSYRFFHRCCLFWLLFRCTLLHFLCYGICASLRSSSFRGFSWRLFSYRFFHRCCLFWLLFRCTLLHFLCYGICASLRSSSFRGFRLVFRLTLSFAFIL